MNPVDVWGVGKPNVKKYIKVTEGCVSPDLVIGLELETENVNTSADAASKMAKPYNFVVENDGSLRGVAYEYISLPMRTEHCLSALTDFLAINKFTDANYTDRCSVHVHVNCTDMQMEQISSLALLYTVMEDIMFEFVGGHRDSNIYCIPWNQCRAHLDLVNKFLGDPNTVLKRWNKYTALNMLPLAKQGTVEFRQMHGTADMKKLGVWINLIGSLFKWAKAYELKVLISELKELNSNSHYEAFFNKIVSGLLPYNEVYREKLEQGVIFAKYSLVSMESKRTKPSAKVAAATAAVPDWLNVAFAEPAIRVRRPEINAAAQRIDAELNAMRQRQEVAEMLRNGAMQAQPVAAAGNLWGVAPNEVRVNVEGEF